MLKPTYQELEELVNNYRELTETQTNIIHFLDEKIRRLKNDDPIVWEFVDKKIDHAKSYRI